MSKEEVQRKYQELQHLTSQLQQMQQQVDLFDQQIKELTRVKDSVEEVSKTDKGTDILTPLGSGVFVKAKLESPKEIIMNVGGDISVIKTSNETIEIIENQINEVKQVIDQIKNNFQQGAFQAQKLQIDIQSSLNKKIEKE